VKAVVQTGFEMPEGADEPVHGRDKDVKDQGHTERTGLHADTDLFHVDPSLTLPVPTHRSTPPMPTAVKPVEGAEKPKKEEKHKHHHHHHRHKDDKKGESREERKKRHEERKKKHEGKKGVDQKIAHYAQGPRLIDVDEPAARPTSTGSPGKMLFSLDDEAGAPVGIAPVAPVVAPTPSFTTTTLSPAEDRPSSKGGESRKRSDSKSSKSRRDKSGEKKERRPKEGRGGEGGDSKHRHHHHHRSAKKAEGAPGSSSASPKPKKEGYL